MLRLIEVAGLLDPRLSHLMVIHSKAVVSRSSRYIKLENFFKSIKGLSVSSYFNRGFHKNTAATSFKSALPDVYLAVNQCYQKISLTDASTN